MNGRKLKFRMWDKVINKMMPDLNTVAFNDPEYEFMQFTGLYDDGDKEIYEGDIVITKYQSSNWWHKIGVVKWKNQSSCFKVIHNGDQCGITNAVEVIGNIFENPELLVDNQP